MKNKKPLPSPPRWADQLLEWFCAPHLLEEIQGDLHERFHKRVKVWGEKEARRQYSWEVVGFLRPFVLKKSIHSVKPNYTAMFQNYLKIALRNLRGNPLFSFINVTGLALGMACSLLILLWVKDELSYDSFHQQGSRMYRVMSNLYWGDVQTSFNTPGPLGEALQREIPEMESVVRVINWDISDLFTVGEKSGKEAKGRYASPDFFRLFTFPLLQGDPKTALSSPNSVVISQNLARKYFGEQNPIGKTIRLRNNGDCQVTGVMQDVPLHSSMQFDFVLPIEPYVKQNEWLQGWGNFSLTTFVMLRPDACREGVEAKIKNLVKKHNPGAKEELFLQPYTEIYLHTYKAGKPDGGRIEYVRLFSVVAVFILLIACINFMNLATARSAKRAKEVGIRKVVGAARQLLIGQFMGEAILIALLAMCLSICLVEGLLPTFNQLTGKTLVVHYLDPFFLLAFAGVAVLTGLVSGSYPALFLSSLKPVEVLKGNLKFGLGALLFRKGLVVFQFTLSLLLMVGTAVVYQQINYIRGKNLGFDRENLVMVGLEGDLVKNLQVVRQELLQSPAIKAMTTISDNLLNIDNSSADLEWPGKSAQGAPAVAGTFVDYDFIRTMRIPMKEGRDFSPDFATDSVAYVINESAARLMGMKAPLGQTISFRKGKGKIIGVTKDFHIQSFHEPIRPLILMLEPRNAYRLLVRTEPGKTVEALASLQKIAHQYNPQYPFEYHFLDEDFERQYKSETMVGQLATYFVVLAVCISCLGLFGLSLFTAEQRTKEIGIRKVLGASVYNIVLLLSRDFLRLVLLAFVMATPIAWYAMYRWLEGFAYRIPLSWWVFVLAGVAALAVALLTVSFQAIKAGLTNPVKSLRTE